MNKGPKPRHDQRGSVYRLALTLPENAGKDSTQAGRQNASPVDFLIIDGFKGEWRRLANLNSARSETMNNDWPDVKDVDPEFKRAVRFARRAALALLILYSLLIAVVVGGIAVMAVKVWWS